jgi:hypothetical protein
MGGSPGRKTNHRTQTGATIQHNRCTKYGRPWHAALPTRVHQLAASMPFESVRFLTVRTVLCSGSKSELHEEGIEYFLSSPLPLSLSLSLAQSVQSGIDFRKYCLFSGFTPDFNVCLCCGPYPSASTKLRVFPVAVDVENIVFQ